jgi:NitT/TauT family transport system permease protein
LLLVVIFLLLWELAAYLGQVSALFFPAPSVIAKTLIRMMAGGQLLTDLTASLTRLSMGLFIGAGLGLVLGLAMGWSASLRRMVDPFIAAVHPIPKISVLPLIMIIFGIGENSKIMVIAIACFFPMLISTMAGVRQISPIHFEVAQSYGASPAKIFSRVLIPGSLPLILAGLRLAVNTALVLTIAVELLTAREGLGASIWLAWETFRTEYLYATLLVVSLLGITFSRGVHYLTTWFVPWQAE